MTGTTGPTPPSARHGGKGRRPVIPVASDLLEVLDALRAQGISFTLDRSARRLELEWSRAPTPAGQAWLEPWQAWLVHVAVGRLSGHAPARCTVCGQVAIVPIVSSSGTRRGRKSAPWQRCRMSNRWAERRAPRGKGTVERLVPCDGVMVISDDDLEGVARVRPPGIPAVKAWLTKQGRPPLELERTGLPWPGSDEPATRAERIARALELGVDPDHIEAAPAASKEHRHG